MRAVSSLLAAGLLAGTAFAGGPRWSAGPGYFSQIAGNPVLWGTTNLRYWTDAGDLSPYVNHAAADAMVATAAAAWNVPVSAMVVSQGGVLAEDVSGANVSMGSSGPIFPGDVQVTNAAAIPVAVIYDEDGAITEMLLGAGASDPGNCRQTAVTESVDSITPAAAITHAVLILNGRCTGAAPEMQMEMTYRLIRAFGRILGVGWSQLNDNVFTGYPQPTYQQALHWPIMHPIDVMCGPYAYQCLPQPFTLRMDDMATMVGLYPESGNDPGKTYAYTQATPYWGTLTFPNGQGMEGVNVVVRRQDLAYGLIDGFEDVSCVTGTRFQQVGVTPVKGKVGMTDSFGSMATSVEGRYDLPWLPINTSLYASSVYRQNVIFTTQPVNSLYTGQYAVGPYGRFSQVIPSGSPATLTEYANGRQGMITANLVAADATASCAAVSDGTPAAPVSVDPSGMWQNAMCGYGHSAWSSVTVKGGRTLTLELTAVDESGMPTAGKMQPVFGVWASTDALGTQPTVASALTPLNAATLGMTVATVSNATARTLRIGMWDQRGDGRPDYVYKARVLYADSVTPAVLPANGGIITITGMGFRNGNAVLVNGVAAQVTSWSANKIVAVAPSMTGVLTADVTVMDISTAGQATVTGAVSYNGTVLPDLVSVVSVPADGSLLGVPAQSSFGVKVLLADGVSPAAGVGVAVSAANSAALAGCGGASGCTLVTDGTGMVSTGVTPMTGGMVALGAQVGTAMATASFLAGSRAADVLRVTSLPVGVVFAGVPAALPWIVQADLGDGVLPDAGAQVTLRAQGAALGGCGGASSCVLTADALGLVATTVTPAAAGVVSLTATAAGGTVAASFGATTMPPDQVRIVAMPGDGILLGATVSFQVQAMLGDGVTPAAGASITLSAIGGGFPTCGGASTCVLTADASGLASTTVTVTLAGVVTLSATVGGGAAHGSFTSLVPPPDRMNLVSAPGAGTLAGSAAGVSFSVRLLLPDGVTPVPGAAVTMTATGASFGACGASTCVVRTDSTGTAASSVAAPSAGPVQLSASSSGASLTVTFTAVADSLRVVSLPPVPVYAGVPTRAPVVMQVLQPDGVTPAAGASVTMTMTLGTIAACGAASCVLTADGQGMVSTLVTPAVKGVVSIAASAGGGTGGTSFPVLTMPSDILRVISMPSGKVYTGVVALAPITIQVMRGDGVNVDAGAAVRILAEPASMSAQGCGLQCTMTADANGLISSPVTPLSNGTITVIAVVGRTQLVTTFTSIPLPADVLTVTSVPANGAAVGSPAAAPFSVQAILGDGRTIAANVSVTLTATGATLGACGRASCVVKSDATGMVSTTVTPTAAGVVSLTASAGGGSVTASFSVAQPPDVVRVVSAPSNGAFVGRVAGLPFQVKVLLADGVTPVWGAAATLTATGGSLGACGLPSCVLTTDNNGLVSTTVTPSAVGTVALSAAAGGGSAGATFAAVLPPDAVTIVSVPASGGFVGRVANGSFVVKVVLGDGTVASGVSVTLTASGATLGACGSSTCVVATDAGGLVTSTVTPAIVGAVGLTASAGGGTASAQITSVALPADALTIVSVPASGGFIGRVANGSFVVKVVLGDGTVASGVPVTLTASGATFGACGSSTCVVATDAGGLVSSTVTPAIVGAVGLAASAGGGTASAQMTSVALPDVVTIVSVPASGGFVGRVANGSLVVKVVLGDGTVASGVPVTLTASGATLGACGSSMCVVITDAGGLVTSTVTPTIVGAIGLTATAGGGTASAQMTSVALPDVVTIVSVPASGGFVGRVANGSFVVKVVLGDGTVASGVPVTLTATGATLGACGSSTCVVVTDAGGLVTSPVTPTIVGAIGLTATAGGGTASAQMTSVALPDVVTVVSVPASGGFVGRAANGSFVVKVVLGDGTAASGVPVALTATGATLGACGSSLCVVATDVGGLVTSTVTPNIVGLIGLTAAAGGGTASSQMTSIAIPADVLAIVSVPASGGYVGRAANGSFVARVVLGDGTVPTGIPVTLTASGATLGVCGSSTCVVATDAGGLVTSTVTPTVVGAIGLTAAALGETASAQMTSVAIPPNVLTIVSVPASGGYVGRAAAGAFVVKLVLGDGTVASGVPVTLTASGATLGACGGSTCVVAADAGGLVTSTVTPNVVGVVGLTAAAAGETASSQITSVAIPADLLTVVQVPASGGFVGDVAGGAWQVKTVLGDGTTPAAGAIVTLTATGGALAICAGTSTCAVQADNAGMVTTAVTPLVSGPIGLTALAGGGTVTTTFSAIDHGHAISLLQSTEYVAAGAQVRWTPQAMTLLDGVPVSGIALTWTGGPGMTMDASGFAAIGPLAAGGTASGQVCAWDTVCASFGAVVVEPAAWQLVLVSGGDQATSVGGPLAPVMGRVTDGAGHGVAGASVTVHQAVSGYVSCPGWGRCPVGPALGAAESVVTSDSGGTFSVTPLVVAGTGETTSIVLTAGDSGYLATQVSLVP